VLGLGLWLGLGFMVTPLLRELYWLQIPEWITFKLSCFIFWSLNGTAVMRSHCMTKGHD